MPVEPSPATDAPVAEPPHPGLLWTGVVGLIYLLLIGVGVIGDGFKWISGGAEGAAQIFAFASNPLFGVILGTLATALVQSSSTVTSVIVGLVAGGVPVSIAIPMIMGANMGTTITNTIVSLGNLREKGAFSLSFKAATVHDFFNLYSIFIFLPVEILFKPLERSSGVIAGWFAGGAADASISDANLLAMATKPVSKWIVHQFEVLPSTIGALLAIAVGIALIMTSVIYLGKLLRSAMSGRAHRIIDTAIGRGPVTGIASGTVVTVLVQSSSTTTSLVVPLAGAGVLTTRQVYPFTLGANIGTCITALLAATAIAGETKVLALQIAISHLLYNVFGVLLFAVIPWLWSLPVRSAEWLGNRVSENRSWAAGYILFVFFVVPGVVFGTNYLFSSPDEEIRSAQEKNGEVEEAKEKVEEVDLGIE
jgi:sodium-dependent phosphate cotransporter